MARIPTFLVCIIVAGLALAAPTRAEGPEVLQDLVAEGLEHNQELRSLEETAAGLRAAAPAAGSLADPVLGLGIIGLPVDTFDTQQEAMTQKQISLSQRVPWFGTLGLAEKAALLKAVRADKQLEAKKLELARKIADAWYELGLVARSLEVNDQLAAMVDQTLKVAETRYATGVGLQQDILSAQVRRTELEDERIGLTQRRRSLEDAINGLLNRERFTSVAPPALPEPALPALDPESLAARALRDNPQVAVRTVEIEMADVEVALAEKAYGPDMTFTVAYGQRDDDLLGRERADLASAQVTLSLPLWQATRQDSKLEAAKKSREAADRALEALKRSLPHRVDALAGEALDLARRWELNRDAILLQGAQRADASLAAYEVGKVEFDTMLNARLSLLRMQLRAETSLFALQRKLAELEEAVGSPLATPASAPAASPAAAAAASAATASVPDLHTDIATR